MSLSRLVQQLKKDEGLRLTVYNDSVGIPTIGYGRNLKDKGITVEMAEDMLTEDIYETIELLEAYLPWYHTLPSARQHVFINMCFNLGIKRFLGFKKFLAAAKDGNVQTAADEMLDSKWAQQVGPRADRLKKLWLEGKYTW